MYRVPYSRTPGRNRQESFRASRLVVMLVLVTTLAGCDPFSSPEGMMDEYVVRVARVLDQEPYTSSLPPRTPFPRPRERVQALPELDLGILDFLSLFGCDLQFVVGERNSVLGRVMQPVNRLRYELRFIEAAEACAPEIASDSLRQDILAAAESKRESLPLAVWNATWGADEAGQLLTASKGAYPVDATGASNAELSVELEQLNRLVTQLNQRDTSADVSLLHQVHQRWYARATAGQLINSARLLTARLDDASRLIEARLEARPLCIGGNPNQQSDIVRSMFNSVFIGRVQPYLAEVRRGRNDVIQPLSELFDLQSDVAVPVVAAWHDRYLGADEGGVWAGLDTSMARHVALWQTLLEQCGMAPGR